jgi:uncharacterized protein (TIGR02996 family)
MLTDGEALRRAIVENPDEDTHRLVFADWLDENRQPDRAAFIRAQIEAARAEPFSPQARAANDKADELLKKHRLAWTTSIRDKASEIRFQRGFVTGVHTEASEFSRVAPPLFEAEPVQELTLSRSPDPDVWASVEPVFEMPHLRRLRQLALAPRLELLYDEYGAISKSQHLDALTDLSLRDNPIDPAWLQEVLDGDRLAALTGLDITDCTNLGPRLVTALEKASHRTFRRLDVTRVMFPSDHLRRMLACRCLQNVEELRVGCVARPSEPGPLFHLDLGWVMPWERLSVLDLSGQHLGDEGVKAITRAKETTALRWLGLANNSLGPESVRMLVAAKQLKLYYLDVRGNGLNSAHIGVLQTRFEDAVVVG